MGKRSIVLGFGIAFLLAIAAYTEKRKHSASIPIKQERVFEQTRARTPDCYPPYSPIWSSDSLVALCLPEGFTVEDQEKKWGRRDYRYYVWRRRVSRLDIADFTLFLWIKNPGREWPFSLPQDCSADLMDRTDCSQTHYLQVRNNSIAGKQVHIETGLVMGGFARTAFWQLVASWRPNSAWYASVDIDAGRQKGMLDTLGGLIRTINIGERSFLINNPSSPP